MWKHAEWSMELNQTPEISPFTQATWILTKKPKPWNEKRASLTNGASLTGILQEKECKLIHIYHSYKIRVQMDQRLQQNSYLLNIIEYRVGD